MPGSTAPRRLTVKDWVAFISPMALVIGSLLAAGNYIAQVKDNTRRIEVLEARNGQRDRDRDSDKDKLNTIDVRTARIESKLEILLPPTKVLKP